MKTLAILLLLIGFNAHAKPQASDFKEILTEEDAAAEKGSDSKDAKSEETKADLKENEEILSGSVRLLRKIERTEVFFKDLKESYFIPSGNNYSSLFKAFSQSQKDGKAVSFKVNTKSRQVLSLESAPAPKAPAAVSTEASGKTGSGSH